MVRDLREINQVLVPRGLRLVPLRREQNRALLYLFRPAHLSRDLSQGEVRQLLRQAGYQDLAQPACLRELKRRLQAGGDFPHEIGLFLGYPPEDVAGFMAHRGSTANAWAAGRSTATPARPSSVSPPISAALPTTAAAEPGGLLRGPHRGHAASTMTRRYDTGPAGGIPSGGTFDEIFPKAQH